VAVFALDWRLWFLQLSGWPVFLTVVAATCLFMVLASVLLTRAANRSLSQVMVIAVVASIAIALLFFGAFIVLTRLGPR
jgi:hypothetical protein